MNNIVPKIERSMWSSLSGKKRDLKAKDSWKSINTVRLFVLVVFVRNQKVW
jgi:hypothetical protein